MLDSQRVAFAAAGTGGILYILCAVFVFFFPGMSLQLLGFLVHMINVEKFAYGVQITPFGFLIGLFEVIVYVYIAASLFVGIYNAAGKR